MKKLITGLLALWIVTGTAAQPSHAQLERARFAIIRETVEFLSEDTTFKGVQSHNCESCNTYEDLKAFAIANNVTNADSKVITPLVNMPIDTAAGKWQQSLRNFQQAAIHQITNGEKAYRKKLDSFEEYTASLEAIVASTSMGINNAAAAEDTLVQSEDTGSTGGIAPATSALATPFSASILLWLPYVLAAGLLFAFIFIFLQNKKLKVGKAYYKKRAHQLEKELQEKSQAIAALTKQQEQLTKDLSDSELDRKSLEDRLKSLQANETAAATAPAAAPTIRPPKAATKPSAPPPPVKKIRYARYADLGDGFSNAELLEKQDGETIFELTIAPNNNSGEYRVTTDPDAQRYALSNAQYFLGKTCLYESFPSGDDALISTDAPGIIKLTGGKWTIVQPAKISFS